MKVQEVRDKFTEYFNSQGHEKVASSSLIPHNDDTLLFANAGMNQFKDFFTGNASPNNKRAVSIQKCVRAGGKHNDLENVGFTARHHTYFEMLGNFSFGDYFKKDAIRFAWDFLTKELGISEEKLIVTVHHSDDEAAEIWEKQIGVPAEKIFRKGDKDNFWEMGEYGPCGPCSEIFYDHGEAHTTPGYQPTPEEEFDDGGRFVEVWNLVFMQYEKTPEGQHKLPNPSIDTGMGLERITAALQGKYWNYDTDAFTPIIAEIEKLSGKKYTDEKYTTNMRVVSDHIRSSVMLITDGIIPSNEGRGYVLRRIIRRAIRHLRELGLKEVSFYKLIPVLFETLGKEYPTNASNASMAEKLLQLEEKKFLETLDQGLKYLNEAIEKDVKDKTLNGESAFKLYDTYGFPLDLTETILQEQGLNVDNKGFDAAMERRKEESRKSWKGGQALDDKAFHAVKEKHGATNFVGYSETQVDAKLISKIEQGEKTILVFDKSTFYGESGGQAGDTGFILEDGVKIAEITDTQKPVDDLHAHICPNGDNVEEGKTYTLQVNQKLRDLTTRNHSATHLLQAALIEVLGDHVKQAGSAVDAERLRFDFTHMQGMTKEEITKVEELVNKKIQEALPVSANIMSMDTAIERGAMALFGEKYGNDVRVLEMGKFSVELCGGTHVQNTSEIGLFSIISESSLSTGVRRIEATASDNAINRLRDRSELLKQIELLTAAKGGLIIDKIEGFMNELKSRQKQIEELNDKLNSAKSGDLFANAEDLGGVQFINTEAPEGSDLRKLGDLFSDKFPGGVLLMTAKSKGKLAVMLRAGKQAKNIKCNNILKETLPMLNGRGGGRPDMAQGSAEGGDMNAFATKVKELIKASL